MPTIRYSHVANPEEWTGLQPHVELPEDITEMKVVDGELWVGTATAWVNVPQAPVSPVRRCVLQWRWRLAFWAIRRLDAMAGWIRWRLTR